MKQLAFIKEERLRKDSHIKDVFRRGIPIKGDFLKIYLLEKSLAHPAKRAAFLVTKALCDKKAVLRNRFRRILREAYRKKKDLIKGSFDIVLLAVRAKENLTSKEIEQDIENVFKRFCKKNNKILS